MPAPCPLPAPRSRSSPPHGSWPPCAPAPRSCRPIRADTVALLPVVRNAVAEQRQRQRRKPVDADPGKDQEPVVVDDAPDIGVPGRLRPADVEVARLVVPGGGAGGQAAENAVFGRVEPVAVRPPGQAASPSGWCDAIIDRARPVSASGTGTTLISPRSSRGHAAPCRGNPATGPTAPRWNPSGGPPAEAGRGPRTVGRTARAEARHRFPSRSASPRARRVPEPVKSGCSPRRRAPPSASRPSRQCSVEVLFSWDREYDVTEASCPRRVERAGMPSAWQALRNGKRARVGHRHSRPGWAGMFRGCQPARSVLTMSFQSVFSGGRCLWKVTRGGRCTFSRKVSAWRSPASS